MVIYRMWCYWGYRRGGFLVRWSMWIIYYWHSQIGVSPDACLYLSKKLYIWRSYWSIDNLSAVNFQRVLKPFKTDRTFIFLMLLLPKYPPLIAIPPTTPFPYLLVLLRKLVSPTRLFNCSNNQYVYDFWYKIIK